MGDNAGCLCRFFISFGLIAVLYVCMYTDGAGRSTILYLPVLGNSGGINGWEDGGLSTYMLHLFLLSYH